MAETYLIDHLMQRFERAGTSSSLCMTAVEIPQDWQLVLLTVQSSLVPQADIVDVVTFGLKEGRRMAGYFEIIVKR